MTMPANIISKRELVVEEFTRRLAEVFPESGIERGLIDEGVAVFDRFYILDMPEACELSDRHRGMYHCIFTISLSYFLQMDKEGVYTTGNYLLEKIRYAIEQDETMGKLVISYSMDEGALIWYDEGVLDVEMVYVVEYTKDAGWVNNPFKPR